MKLTTTTPANPNNNLLACRAVAGTAAAACENILLAAHALGLAGKWRTGDTARDPLVKKFLGFTEDQHIVSFLYIGYPDVAPEDAPRPGFEDRTVWME